MTIFRGIAVQINPGTLEPDEQPGPKFQPALEVITTTTVETYVKTASRNYIEDAAIMRAGHAGRQLQQVIESWLEENGYFRA